MQTVVFKTFLMSVLLCLSFIYICGPFVDFPGLVGQRLVQRTESSRAGGHPGHQIFSLWQTGLPAGQERLRPETPPAPEALGCSCHPGCRWSTTERWGSFCSVFFIRAGVSLVLPKKPWWMIFCGQTMKSEREQSGNVSFLPHCLWYSGDFRVNSLLTSVAEFDFWTTSCSAS